MDEWFALKRSSFLGKNVAYICQNINGPCPLLAVANVLLLRGHLSLKELTTDGDFVSARDLLAIVHRRIVDTNPPLTNGTELERLTQEKTLKDVRQLLPSMFVGLDVNVRFHNITDFEYTVACAVFDMLDIQLVHGWLIDQQDTATLRVVGNKSYNELIERLVDYRGVLMTEETEGKEAPSSATTGSETSGSSPDSGPSISAIAVEQAPPSTIPVETLEFQGTGIAGLTIDVTQPLRNSTPGGSPSSTPKKSPSQKTVETLVKERHLSDADAVDTATTLLEEGPILEDFFNSTASQLTYYGLVKLHEDIRERQLCVFFRNNHFSTLFKYEGALYLLATDAGYLDEPSIVWERLNEIDGDTEYVDANFRRVGSSERQQTLYSHRQDDPMFNSSDQSFQALGGAAADGANIPDESSREVSSASDNDYHSTSDGQDETRAVQHSADQSHKDNKQNLDPDYLLALRLQEEEEAHAQRAKGGTIVNIAPRSLQPIGADRDGGSANVSENDESYGGLRETSEDEYVPVIVDGEVIVSAEEMEAQRKAALYYAQQKRQLDAQTAQLQQQHQAVQQQQLPQQTQPNQGRFRGMRRSIAGESTGGDCCIS